MSERALGPLLTVFGAAQLILALLQAFFPGTFFDEIGPFGARNDHYLGDVASFYAATGVVALVAARRPSWRVPVLAFALVQYVLHAINHAVDVGEADPEWLGPATLIALLATAALLAWMLWAAARSDA
jgi:hypothetical protein